MENVHYMDKSLWASVSIHILGRTDQRILFLLLWK